MQADLDAFARIFTDPEVMRYVAWGRPLTAAEVEEFVERMIACFDVDGFAQFALERRADGAVVGRAGLLSLDPATWKSGFFREGIRVHILVTWKGQRAQRSGHNRQRPLECREFREAL